MKLDHKYLGNELKSMREASNLSQREVAEEIQTTSQFISNWERGVSSPPFRILKLLAKLYKKSTVEMLAHCMVASENTLRKELGIKI